MHGEQPHVELLAPHFQAEDPHRHPALVGDVEHDVQHEGGLSDGGARRENQQVALVEPVEQPITVPIMP